MKRKVGGDVGKGPLEYIALILPNKGCLTHSVCVCVFLTLALLLRLGELLDDNENEVLVRCNHDLVLLAADTEKCQVVCGIEVSDAVPSLSS